MAKITLAMATTHGPQLHTTVDQWTLRVPADKVNKHPFRGQVLGYEELVALRKPEGLDKKSTYEAMSSYHARCHDAMERLAQVWDERRPDVAVIFGNDQNEVFEQDQLNPMFFVFYGDKIPNYLQSDERRSKLPPGIAEAEHGHATEAYTEYRGEPSLGSHILKTLVEHDFDVAASKIWPKTARNGAPHALGHIYRQVMRDDVVPNVPIIQNTFFPPNQPSARRAYEFGRTVKKAIDSWESNLTVGLFASGGMSHFVIDEEFDRNLLAALRTKDKDFLTSVSLADLQSGTSELKSWITLAGALEDLPCTMEEIDYIPCYRSPAGTGTANGFYWWDLL